MTKIIITNDDGIEAPGIQTLYRAARELGEILVVAPRDAQSGASHAVTTHSPIQVTTWKENWYAVEGTPADCSRLALTQLAPGADWVLSGINRGGNLGADTYISGTVAAAREATFLGFRSIAFSQYLRPKLKPDWDWTQRQVAELLPRLMNHTLGPRTFLNVNLPHLEPGAPDPEVVFCGVDTFPLDVSFEIAGSFDGQPTLATFNGIYTSRKREPGRDVDVCFGGRIAVTEIPLAQA